MEIKVIKKNGLVEDYDKNKIFNAVKKAAMRASIILTDNDYDRLDKDCRQLAESRIRRFSTKDGQIFVPVAEMHLIVEKALKSINDEVAQSYKEFRNYKIERNKMMEEVLNECDSILLDGDKSNANSDDRLSTTKAFLDSSAFSKQRYLHYFLTKEEKQANDDGYIYIHDLNRRLYTMNCCVINIENIFNGGFTMGNIRYTEPKTLSSCFNLLGDVILSASSQQYGGFTIPEIDKFLEKYAIKSYNSYYQEFLSVASVIRTTTPDGKTHGHAVEEKKVPFVFDVSDVFDFDKVDDDMATQYAMSKVNKDFEQGFQGLECMLNSCANAKGDYSFVTFTFGLGTSEFTKMASKTLLEVRMKGQGPEGHKQTVLFPKLIFLYDHYLHGEGGKNEDLFNLAIKCSSKCMYPDYTPVDVNSNKEIERIYRNYGMPLSQMGCRSAVSPFYESGNWEQQDEDDLPVMTGRFNLGVVSLNLCMILAKAQGEARSLNKTIEETFYNELDYYLEMIRQIHIKTYLYLKDMKASMHPLAFCEGGFWHGYLNPDDKIEPCLKAATYSFGITGLNELEELYHQKSLVEDGSFALEVMKYINDKVKEFKYADNKAYSIYGTPAESLSSKQVTQFRKKYGIVPKVSDRDYFSNSFHCHVSEEITQVEKQDYEERFWKYFEGGRIQYVRYDSDYNLKAMAKLTRRALDKGFYNGINLSKSYCNDCGNEMVNSKCKCSKCGSENLTVIERVCGYLGYYKTDAKNTRMNKGKIEEINDRKSM